MKDLLYYSPKKIIKNPEPLDTSGNFIPSELPHRQDQILKIRDETLPAMLERAFTPIHIYGKPGTGKTVVIRYVMSRLEKESKGCVAVFYTSFKESKINTDYKFYKEFLLSQNVKVPMRGMPLQDLYKKFKEFIINHDAKVLVFVLDEVDMAPTDCLDTILYNLRRMEVNNKETTIVSISNSTQFFARLEPRTRSSFNPKILYFPPYNAKELGDILNYLADISLNRDEVTSPVIPKIAAIASQEGGDCRFALDVLRISAEIAEKEKRKIKEQHVDMAIEFIEKENTKKEVLSLPLHHKFILKALMFFDKYPVKIGNLYEKYKEISYSAVSFRRMKDFVTDLDKMDIITTSKKYGGKGGTTTFVGIDDVKKPIIKESLEK